MASISTTPDFISELVRAVNQIHLLTLNERKEMVARGIARIHELRHTLDGSGADTPMASRALSEIGTLIEEMDDTPDELVAAAFMVLCDEINTLLKVCETASAPKRGEP
ncbi:hypothetical protein ATY81_00940 [Rhizobium sp. R72]|uniref:hypothetical protein n=1 Tax=unclassified Rhizobium TaxID=2613769 RepID=UPI000B536638|nr:MULTISPECIES: hypothetical protein [unclassified Rhizobium]OWW04588.1 hypothetical protein ATY81_00940 [Rhizobium sp. R72]OWW05645.1 hypothetical protein ATY80_00940 [Rhizobium sp. R711]